MKPRHDRLHAMSCPLLHKTTLLVQHGHQQPKVAQLFECLQQMCSTSLPEATKLVADAVLSKLLNTFCKDCTAFRSPCTTDI